MSLTETVRTLMRDGKVILDAGRDNDSLDEFLSSNAVAPTDAARKTFRDILLRADGIERHLSGAILSDAALAAVASDMPPYYDMLSEKKILVGASFSADASEQDLKKRITEHRSRAVVFAKLSLGMHSAAAAADAAFKENLRRAVEHMHTLHELGLVPILSAPLDGRGTHTAGEAEDHLVETASLTADALESAEIDMKNTVLGLGMAVPGADNPGETPAAEVAERTYRALTSSVPETVGGIVFFTGNGSADDAEMRMNALARLEPFPWPLTFAFGGAHQQPVLSAWKGSDENIPAAESAYLRELSEAVSADTGGYSRALENF